MPRQAEPLVKLASAIKSASKKSVLPPPRAPPNNSSSAIKPASIAAAWGPIWGRHKCEFIDFIELSKTYYHLQFRKAFTVKMVNIGAVQESKISIFDIILLGISQKTITKNGKIERMSKHITISNLPLAIVRGLVLAAFLCLSPYASAQAQGGDSAVVTPVAAPQTAPDSAVITPVQPGAIGTDGQVTRDQNRFQKNKLKITRKGYTRQHPRPLRRGVLAP